MKKVKKIIRLFGNYQIQFFLIVLTIALGLSGYWGYYHYGEMCWPLFRPVFSTIKLFAGAIEYDKNGVAAVMAHAVWPVVFLVIARWTALLVTGNAIFKIIKDIFPKAFSQLRLKIWKKEKKQLLLIGNNEENIHLCKSADDSYEAMLFSEKGKDIQRLRDEEISCYMLESGAAETELTNAIRTTLSTPEKDLTVIINTKNDEFNLRLCRAAAETVQKAVMPDKKKMEARIGEIKDRKAQETDPEILNSRRKIVEKLERIRIYAFGEKQYEQIYLALENASFGVLHYTNKYHLCSFEFISQHPITEYLTGKNAAYLKGDGCIDADMDLNMIFVGFGDTNREIFLDSFSTNQFITHQKNELPGLKTASYHIFDKKARADQDKNLNHTIYRYLDDFKSLLDSGKLKREDYLEIPEIEKGENYEIDINSEQFYQKIREICSKNRKSVNYIMIAFGDDFNNIDLAQRLAEKKSEWGLSDLHIFVRVCDAQNEKMAAFLDEGAETPYLTYGRQYFTLEEVIHNEIEEIAFQRTRAILNAGSIDDPVSRLNDGTVLALYKWYTMDQFMRRSNFYNILALRMKFQLLGLDYRRIENGRTIDLKEQEDAYYRVYAAGSMPEDTKTPESYRGARKDYSKNAKLEEYKKYIPRMNLAVQEHYRWNAYMIRCGFIPATLEQIRNGQIKSYTGARFHANLSSFAALFTFWEMQKEYAARTGSDKEPENVVNYDYVLMDEAGYFLGICGYEIIKR